MCYLLACIWGRRGKKRGNGVATLFPGIKNLHPRVETPPPITRSDAATRNISEKTCSNSRDISKSPRTVSNVKSDIAYTHPHIHKIFTRANTSYLSQQQTVWRPRSLFASLRAKDISRPKNFATLFYDDKRILSFVCVCVCVNFHLILKKRRKICGVCVPDVRSSIVRILTNTNVAGEQHTSVAYTSIMWLRCPRRARVWQGTVARLATSRRYFCNVKWRMWLTPPEWNDAAENAAGWCMRQLVLGYGWETVSYREEEEEEEEEGRKG